MRASEVRHLIPMCEPKDYGSAGIDFDSVHLGKLNSLSIAILFGALTGNSILTVNAGATEGTKTTALAFNYRFGGGDFKAASADILGDVTAVAAAGLSLVAATFDHREIVIEIDSDQATDAKPWLTVAIDATATVMTVAAVGVGTPRFQGHTSITAIK